jgi:hypothetical protein
MPRLWDSWLVFLLVLLHWRRRKDQASQDEAKNEDVPLGESVDAMHILNSVVIKRRTLPGVRLILLPQFAISTVYFAPTLEQLETTHRNISERRKNDKRQDGFVHSPLLLWMTSLTEPTMATDMHRIRIPW